MSKNDFDVKSWFKSLIEPLVDHPDECRVEVSRSHGGSITTIEVFAKKSDYGKIIGRRGKTFDTLEAILKAVEWRDNSRYLLRVDPPSQEVSERP